jgi:hypothetical protein
VGAGLLLLLWAATTGPVRLVGPSGRRFQREYPPTPTPSPSPATGGPAPSGRTLTGGAPTYDLSWLGDLVTWTLLLVLVLAVVYGVVWLWQNRWRGGPRPVEREFAVLPEAGALPAAITEGADEQLAAVLGGTPRDGIIRCWLRLEEAVARAGVVRAPSETSAELTVRVLRTLDVDPRAVASLARLYREARFSRHPLGEDSRVAARAALTRLHRDLRLAGASASGAVR